MLEWIFSENFLVNVIAYAIPIIFAAYASLISNKAGISAINIEGAMSVAAVTGALVSHFANNWVIGLACAMSAGILMMMLLALSALKLKADSFLSGIALNTFATGACLLIVKGVLDGRTDSSTAPSVLVPHVNIPLLSDIPVIGKAIFGQNLLFFIMLAVLALLIVLLNCTRLGVQIKTAGYHPEAGESVGVSVKRTRVIALIICGAMAGLGGAYLSMANLGYFSAGMVSGRGFIGIAAEAMGAGMPIKTTLFAFLFGAVDYFAVGGQTVLSFPYELLNTLPYLMTLLALTIYAVAHKKKNVKK
ncbi:MAG: ABC transporter permease [Clostridiales bacterium]|nr:ABC transporter permease [Clostridiales bacterium]